MSAAVQCQQWEEGTSSATINIQSTQQKRTCLRQCYYWSHLWRVHISLVKSHRKLKQMPALHLFKLFKDHWTKTSAPFLRPTSWQKILRIPIQFNRINRCLVYFYVVDGTLWVPNDPPNLSTSITSWWNFSLLAWPRYNEDLSNPGPVKPLYNWASPIPTT